MSARVLEVSALFRDYATLVERVLRRAGVEARDVPDARQEVFLVALRRLSEFEGRAQPSTWLCAIAIRVASDFRRKAHRRREHPEAAQGCAEAADDAYELRPEQRDDLLQALEALDQVAAPQREVFVLFELLELPMNEVAARVGCPSKTAFSRLYAARRQLQVELRKRGLLAGVWPWFVSPRGSWAGRAHDGVRATRDALAHGAGGAWPSWAVGTAALALLVCAPQATPMPADSKAAIAAESRAVDALAAREPSSAIASRSGFEIAGAPPAPRERESPRGHRSQRRTPQAERPAAPPMAATATIDGDDFNFRVMRAGAHDPAPVGEHPWAYLLQPEARAPVRLRVRGPADPADAIEEELREF